MEEIAREEKGNKIRYFRLKKNMTQEELAKAAGCARSTITRIEIGIRNPSFDIAIMISKALDEPVEKVFFFEKNKF